MKEKKQKFEKLFLKYEYSAEERTDIAGLLAAKTQTLDRVRDDKKAAAAQFKSQEDQIQAEINDAAKKYSNGFDMRDIECEVVMDYENGIVRYYRTDNGLMAQERKMTNGERQQRLDEVDVDPVEEADNLAAEQHQQDMNRFMSKEKAVSM